MRLPPLWMRHVACDQSLNRREFLGAAAVAGYTLSGSVAPSAAATAASQAVSNETMSLADNVYTRLLGVRPHLGAHEHISRLGGGRMSREVLDAMAEANEYFVICTN